MAMKRKEIPANINPRLMLSAVSSLLVSNRAKYARATRNIPRPDRECCITMGNPQGGWGRGVEFHITMGNPQGGWGRGVEFHITMGNPQGEWGRGREVHNPGEPSRWMGEGGRVSLFNFFLYL